MSLADQVEHELLPTPKTSDMRGAGVHRTMVHSWEHQRDGKRGERMSSVGMLFPTPSASQFNDSETPEQWQARYELHASKAENPTRAGKPLAIAAAELLPTPTVGNIQGGNKTRSGPRSDEVLLPGAVEEVHFGKYASSIARAEEVSRRVAPAPAIPDGKGGKRRLHSRFVEWMMLLPDGWVTGRGLGRSAELARLGNGVVPLQAAYAVRELVMRAAVDR